MVSFSDWLRGLEDFRVLAIGREVVKAELEKRGADFSGESALVKHDLRFYLAPFHRSQERIKTLMEGIWGTENLSVIYGLEIGSQVLLYYLTAYAVEAIAMEELEILVYSSLKNFDRDERFLWKPEIQGVHRSHGHILAITPSPLNPSIGHVWAELFVPEKAN